MSGGIYRFNDVYEITRHLKLLHGVESLSHPNKFEVCVFNYVFLMYFFSLFFFLFFVSKVIGNKILLNHSIECLNDSKLLICFVQPVAVICTVNRVQDVKICFYNLKDCICAFVYFYSIINSIQICPNEIYQVENSETVVIEEQFEKNRNMRLDVERYRSMADKTMFDRVHIGEWFILNDEI